MRYIIAIILLSCMTILSAQAETSTLRCGAKIVNVGDRNFDVQRKCGDPAMRNFIGYTDGMRGGGDLPIEEWIYNRSLGSGTDYDLLRFEGGKLIRIESHYPVD